jgi:tricorn protease
MRVLVDPRHEWREEYTDAWRRYRDWFYDPHMHGVDWLAMRERYSKMLDDCASRGDVGYVIRELISELNVGHAYYNPSEVEGELNPAVPVGLLGCDYALEQGAYRIQTIYEGGPWDVDARGPLSQPGVDAKVGDFLLAVDGVPLDPAVDPWAPFVGKADAVVALTLSDKPVIDASARTVLVKPVASDADLRYRAWVEMNRAHVSQASDGKVGYIHVPDTGVNGQNNLFRQFYGQIDKPALIIDERWNGGGQIPTRFIELLRRPATNFWTVRDSKPYVWPPDSHQGPMCMLINQRAGSGGDAFPYYFREARLGPLIGVRTWGGLVGIGDLPDLLDGASVSVPNFAFYELDGTWGVEGYGVAPDVEVVDDPALMVNGAEPQLDKAIELMLDALKQGQGFELKPVPPYPDRSGMGLRPEDR